MKHILSSLVVLAGGLTVTAANVTDIKELNNTTLYNITRIGTSSVGGGVLHAVEGSDVINTAAATKVDKSSPEASWSLHYSAAEKTYYLYNMATGKFASGNSKNQAVFTETATDCMPLYNEEIKYWLLDCGGYVLGLPEDYHGTALFNDDITKEQARTEYLSYFTIAPVEGATLTSDQVAEIEAKVLAGRAAKIAEYQEFVNMAEGMSNPASQQKFIGFYDLTALKEALADPDNYTLAEFETLYQQALLSRYPKDGEYYRLRNRSRPGSYSSNLLCLTASQSQLKSRQLKNPAFATATDGYADDLGLLRFWPVNGDPTQVKFQVAANGKYLTLANNSSDPGFTSSRDDAFTFTLETIKPNQRYYRFRQGANDSWLTVGGSMNLVGYNVEENSMQFFIEKVTSISVPVDANGYATVCLPCGVVLPEGCTAYTVTDFSNGKAYLEEVASPIHLSTPFILKAPAGTASVDLELKNTTNWVASAMTGCTALISDAPGRYVPSYSANGISFTYETSATALPGSAYLVSENIGDITTVMGANPEAGIVDITVDQAAETELYDLQGRKVSSTPRSGIYINAVTKRPVRIN